MRAFASLLQKALKYPKHNWEIISDFKMIAFLMDLQGGYIKFQCYLCIWHSRAEEKHFHQRFWCLRVLKKGKENVKYDPLVDCSLILLPPLEIRLYKAIG